MAILTIAGAEYRVRAILFDKDGTLMDFIHTWGYWGERLLARFSIGLEERRLPPLPEPVSSLLGTQSNQEGDFADYDRNGPLAMGTVDDLIAVLAWQGYRSGLSWAEAKVLAYDCKTYADGELDASRKVRPLPHVVPFLERCRDNGVKLAIVTADETASAVKHLEWMGLEAFFAAVVGSDRTERGKPFPDMAELACRELGIPCAQAAIIGDTNGDMRMAKAAGAAIAVGIGGSSVQDAAMPLPDADIVITSYLELDIRGDMK